MTQYDLPYEPLPFATRPVAVDVIVRHEGGVVLIKRGRPPYLGYWALPGGFVEIGESVESCGVREVREETGLLVELERLVGVYSAPGRDPERHTIAVCFLAISVGGTLQSGDDAAEAQVFTRLDPAILAFDHAQMCGDAGVLHR